MDLIDLIVQKISDKTTAFELTKGCRPKYIKIPDYTIAIIRSYSESAISKHKGFNTICGMKICSVDYDCDIEVF